MSPENPTQIRAHARLLYQQACRWVARVPIKARVVLALFLAAAVLMAVHTALTAKDANLHLKLQHNFRDAQVSLWVDDDLAFSGKLTGVVKKRFGLIPTDTAQGSLSQVIPVRAGRHTLRVRIQPDDGAAQEDIINGDFPKAIESVLLVSAHHSSMAMSWQGGSSAPVETANTLGWLTRYASSFFLTIAGSIMSAVAGYVLKELPSRLRPARDTAPKAELGHQ